MEVAAGGMEAKEKDVKNTQRAINSNFRRKRGAEQACSEMCRAWEARIQVLQSSCG